jgi:hypothetical protein
MSVECDCVTVAFSEPIEEAEVVSRWAGFLKLKSRILIRLADKSKN